MKLPLGKFHEISITTRSLSQSIAFYESLGFRRGAVEPVWPHPYAVVSLGPLHLGLHEYRFPSPSFTTVHADIESLVEEYRSVGMHLAFAKTGPDCFNEFGFRDPGGNMITVLERSTHRALDTDMPQTSATLGEFFAYGLPTPDREVGIRFWKLLGAQEELERTHDELRLHAAGLAILLDDVASFDRPTLLFRQPGASSRDRFESPDGTCLVRLADQ